jgi:gamma-glutamylcyclotransferase (GGCT)/AIG2-like uncharacterized protein YtfP|tara:strand:- start:63 stop:473 length:411 start_codon:yes stop_codon:yes gene_type:complete
MVSNELLFVYGTLRKGAISPMDKLLSLHCEFFADAFIQGILYDVDGYPGVIESHTLENKVYGELYTIRWASQLWPRLDHYEHCSNAFQKPHEYARKKRPVSLVNGQNIQAWIYLFNWKTGGLLKIPSGDYLSYLQG